MTEEAGYEYSTLTTRRLQGRYLYPLVLIMLVAAALIWSGTSNNSTFWQKGALQAPKASTNALEPLMDQISKLENCTLPEPPAHRNTWTTKPLFVSGYTASSSFETKGESDFIKPIIRQLTGNSHGARNYHARMSGMKHCHTASSETVTCSQGHPISPITPGRLTGKFDSRVIFFIQNFVMAFPMGASVKANRYAHVQGQMNLETWRQTRDMYLEQAFPKWKSVITAWKSLRYYRISIYLPYEHLLDPVKGPLAIQQLSKVIESAGFAVVVNEETDGANDDDISSMLWQCIWKQSVEKVVKSQKDYIKYIPPYTARQRDYVLQQMQFLIEEMTAENDTELVNILKDYYAEIRDFTPIEDENIGENSSHYLL